MTFINFVILGISSLLAQVIIIRELLHTFEGNEFFIGLILASWLFWTAVGSFLLAKLINRFSPRNIFRSLIASYFLVALFLPLEIFLIRMAKSLTGLPGEIPNLLFASMSSIFILAPICIALGFQFTIGTRIFARSLPKKSNSPSLAIGKGYLFEILGFILAGLAFNFFLVKENEFLAAFLVSALNILAVGLIIKKGKRFVPYQIIIGVLCSIFVFLAFSNVSDNFNDLTQQLRFPNQKLVETTNSLYGNISVTKIKEQYNFFGTGSLLGPAKEVYFNEHLVHFPLLFHPKPEKILLIGNGFNGAITQILKHEPEEIYYIELDPILLETARNYLPEELKQDLAKVQTINLDSRYFFKQNSEKFDVIIVNAPDPSTALLNRFYTQEYFQEVKNHLQTDGIFLTHLNFSPNYLNKELENLNTCIYKTIKQVFPFLIILPEDTNFFIASSKDILNYEPQPLIQRLEERQIKTDYINEKYIQYRLTNDRVSSALSTLENNTEAKINKDLVPSGYNYNIIYWFSIFYPKLSQGLSSLSRTNFLWLFLLLALLLGVSLILNKKTTKTKGLILAMAIAGFSLMSIETVLILGFQLFFGYLYYRLALLIAILMVGMALGAWLSARKLEKIKSCFSRVIDIHLAIIMYCFLLILAFHYLPKIEILFLIEAFLAGLLIGLEFPLLNKLYLENKEDCQKKTGIIYSADLIGSCFGALLPGLILIPIFGITQALIFVVLTNLGILLYLYFGVKKSGR